MSMMDRSLLLRLLDHAGKALILLVFLFPFLWMISTSLQTFEETMSFPPVWVPSSLQWGNFAEAMTAGPFLTYARNSIVITTAILILQFAVMIPAAYAFAKYTFAGSGLMFGLVLLAFMIPSQITFIPVYMTMADWGWVDTLLPQIVPFMSNAFGIFLLRQYFRQIPQEIIESARLDNAGEFKIITRLMVPMSMPALATIALFSFVSHWNDYFWPLVMTDATHVRPLTLGIAKLRETEGISNWNIIMAGNVILVLPILIVYLFCSKQIVKAFVYSGIK
ncbi:binding-protein-dependent transport systems inner membrane component [Paenibacillus mucilaginosus 3016]|uniref:Binding-protein-dependent transport systems inner membrane component n=2 Tax=Paenibacillus mucilaginosus TaxID=61624 RepID=H6NEI1_9BACL|nr:carbohydrate ABC transporter permease [Paenibacillus mucilaginosus]AFC28124.1 binding-protein-dependent transport systems inner membrane component [Paenibacillus mucilaginosus 3016]WFA16968.1 carbohydrate ABC transporter permease [Paenibacillus mucilaginosus]